MAVGDHFAAAFGTLMNTRSLIVPGQFAVTDPRAALKKLLLQNYFRDKLGQRSGWNVDIWRRDGKQTLRG